MDTQSRAPEGRKKSYRQPELHVYGNLTQITATVGNMGANDGGTVGNFKKTQP